MQVEPGHKRAEGFSLIDLMIGAIVGVILIGAVLSMIVQQSKVRQANQETSLALGACINNIEKLRVLDSDALKAMDGRGFDVPGPNGENGGLTPLPDDADGMPGALSVVTDAASGDASLFLVVATVRWRGVTGRRLYTLQTLMGERK